MSKFQKSRSTIVVRQSSAESKLSRTDWHVALDVGLTTLASQVDSAALTALATNASRWMAPRSRATRPTKTNDIQLRPGLTASVEIKAMERSVLSYLTKPLIKTFSQSLGAS